MAYKDKSSGKWVAQWYTVDLTGKKSQRKKRGFRTLREAKAYEAEKNLVEERSLRVTLQAFAEIYFEDKKHELKERTINNKKYMMDRHIFPFFADKKMAEIAPSDIIRWQNHISGKGYSEAYMRMLQNQLTALFNHASKIYDLQVNPCKKVRRLGRNDSRSLNFWTYDEYRQFISHLSVTDKYYYIFELLYWTGMREGELLALASEDFDFSKKQIFINKTFYRKDRKDVITEPKTEQSVRTIDIPEFLCREIEEYLSRLYGLPGDERIFPVVAEAVQHKLKREVEKAGVKKIRVHDFRHSHVAYLIDQGVDPLIIKERLGHKDIRITLNTYGHLYPSRQREVADLLDKAAKRKESEGKDE